MVMAGSGAHSSVWDWDLTTSRIHYSPGWISMLGCAGADFGNTVEEWFRRIHPDDLEPVQREIDTHLSRGSAQFELRHRMLHQDGCYRYMACRGVITRDASGRAVRITGFHLDITSEKVTDPLTGLPNRLLLLDRLTRSIEKARKREDFIFAVLTVDLDLFESGIDRLQTINTDSMIVSIARRLETWLRGQTVSTVDGRAHLVARSGGEEFTVLLDGLSCLNEAKETADKLLKELLAPFEFNGSEVFLSPSIGIALSATGYRNAEEALRDADTALYRAKTLGKSRCEVFDTAVLESVLSQNRLEQDLNEALIRNQFIVFYQPILSLTSGRIAGFEALIRWNHPSKGLVLPMEFIPVAEKSGLIIPLSRWVLQEACRQLKTWRMDPRIPKDLWISVNLSGAHFTEISLAAEIREILRAADLEANGLMLELTEGTVMRNPDAARSILMQLRVMGARIGLDDFGTGYSSLAHLRRFPLDYLKIDKSFIKGIENRADVLEIVQTIHTLARQLGLRVIAEGIENPRQLDLLRSLQCEFGQGFLFSRAVDGKQAESLLLNGFVPANESDEAAVPLDVSVLNDPQSSLLPVPGCISEPELSRMPAACRKYVIAGAAVVILLIAGLLVGRMNRLPAPAVTAAPAPISVAESKIVPAPATSPATAEKAADPEKQEQAPAARVAKARNPVIAPGVIPKEAPVPNTPKSGSAAAVPAPPVSALKISPKIAPEVVYALQVDHDHAFGSCKGVLKFNRSSVSFVSEKGKDSFYFHYPEYSYTLDRDHLTIKAGSDKFRFKSSSARTKGENRSQLSDFYRRVSSLYKATASRE